MRSQANKKPVERRTAIIVIVTAIFVAAIVWWRVTAPQAEPGPADVHWSWVLPEDPHQIDQFRAKVLDRKSHWEAGMSGGSPAPAGRR
jgi:hypothetical protein